MTNLPIIIERQPIGVEYLSLNNSFDILVYTEENSALDNERWSTGNYFSRDSGYDALNEYAENLKQNGMEEKLNNARIKIDNIIKRKSSGIIIHVQSYEETSEYIFYIKSTVKIYGAGSFPLRVSVDESEHTNPICFISALERICQSEIILDSAYLMFNNESYKFCILLSMSDDSYLYFDKEPIESMNDHDFLFYRYDD